MGQSGFLKDLSKLRCELLVRRCINVNQVVENCFSNLGQRCQNSQLELAMTNCRLASTEEETRLVSREQLSLFFFFASGVFARLARFSICFFGAVSGSFFSFSFSLYHFAKAAISFWCGAPIQLLLEPIIFSSRALFSIEKLFFKLIKILWCSLLSCPQTNTRSILTSQFQNQIMSD